MYCVCIALQKFFGTVCSKSANADYDHTSELWPNCWTHWAAFWNEEYPWLWMQCTVSRWSLIGYLAGKVISARLVVFHCWGHANLFHTQCTYLKKWLVTFLISLVWSSSVSISVSIALEVYLYTMMRYINRRFTYLLTPDLATLQFIILQAQCGDPSCANTASTYQHAHIAI